MTGRDYKEVLGFEPPLTTITALILIVVVFAISCIAIGFAIAKYF
jgi:hypothetical protein